MDDLINRQDVLNLCDMRDKYKIPYEYDDGSKHIKGYDEGRIINVTKLKMLPSVNLQEKIGYWIDADGDNAICSCCNRLNHLYGTYCKHCGARMQTESNIKQGLNYADADTLMSAT